MIGGGIGAAQAVFRVEIGIAINRWHNPTAAVTEPVYGLPRICWNPMRPWEKSARRGGTGFKCLIRNWELVEDACCISIGGSPSNSDPSFRRRRGHVLRGGH